MVGLPRSGKTSRVNKYLEENPQTVPVCSDDIRKALRVGFDRRLEPFVWTVAYTMARALLYRKLNVIIDNTNITRAERRRWIEIGNEFEAKISFNICNLPETESGLQELRLRADMAGYPDFLIDYMHKKYEPPTPDEICSESYSEIVEGSFL